MAAVSLSGSKRVIGDGLGKDITVATDRLQYAADGRIKREITTAQGGYEALIDELLHRKPHLASRRPFGEIGQGASDSPSTVDVAAILRQKAQ